MSNDSNSSAFDPYRVWLGIPKAEQPPNHYRLLGVSLFECDPEVIQEGADRQVAHLKTKQTGARVRHSQKLLQEVVAAVGCLLDEQAKAKYDRKLREALKPTAIPDPAPAKPKQLEPKQPESNQEVVPQPVDQQQPVYQQPVYQQPLVPPPVSYQPQPMRPIPVPMPEPQAAESAGDVLPKMPTSFRAMSSHGRAKNESADMLKLAVAGGVALLLLVIAWAVLSQPGMLGEVPSKPVAKATGKLKPVIKHAAPVPAAPLPAAQPSKPAETTVAPNQPEAETPASAQPTQPAIPEPTTPAPAPSNPPTPASQTPTPIPMPTPAPTPTGLTNPMASTPPPTVAPTIPQPAKPAAKTLWRHSGGYIEQQADGSWKELSPTGDYFTLTMAGGSTGDVLEFDRPGGMRLRVFDNHLEQATAAGTFAEVAKGNWCMPVEDLDLETQQQAMLQRACQVYAEALAKARRKLLQQFDDAISSNRKRIGKADERLALITLLEAEKARFETEGLVPWSLPMQVDTAKYLADVQQARGPADALFQKVMTHFVARKDDQTASSVEVLKHKVLAPLVIAKLTKIDVPPPPSPFNFGKRRRDDNDLPDDDGSFNDDPRTGLIRLWSNGAVNNANGKSAWTIAMGTLQLQFVRPRYSIVDTITTGPQGDELSGKSAFSTRFSLNFTGKFENALAPEEHRPQVKFSSKAKAETGAEEATE